MAGHRPFSELREKLAGEIMEQVERGLEEMDEAPPGVHVLSEESQAALSRAAIRGMMIANRHIKRGS